MLAAGREEREQHKHAPQTFSPVVEINNLRRGGRELLVQVLEERFLAASRGMLLCSLPSKAALGKLAKWSAKDCAVQCSVRIPDTDMRLV